MSQQPVDHNLCFFFSQPEPFMKLTVLMLLKYSICTCYIGISLLYEMFTVLNAVNVPMLQKFICMTSLVFPFSITASRKVEEKLCCINSISRHNNNLKWNAERQPLFLPNMPQSHVLHLSWHVYFLWFFVGAYPPHVFLPTKLHISREGRFWWILQDAGISGLSSKTHMKLMLKWMRGRSMVKQICNIVGSNKKFLLTTFPEEPQSDQANSSMELKPRSDRPLRRSNTRKAR